MAMINLFLDDMRPAPDGFVHVKNYQECIEFLEEHQGNLNILSLDNRLGSRDQPTGRHVAEWMIKNKIIFPREIYIHTASYSERTYIYNILKDHIKRWNLECEVYLYPYSDRLMH